MKLKELAFSRWMRIEHKLRGEVGPHILKAPPPATIKEHPTFQELADAIRAEPTIPTQFLADYVAGRLDGSIKAPGNTRQKRSPYEEIWDQRVWQGRADRVSRRARALKRIRKKSPQPTHDRFGNRICWRREGQFYVISKPRALAIERTAKQLFLSPATLETYLKKRTK